MAETQPQHSVSRAELAGWIAFAVVLVLFAAIASLLLEKSPQQRAKILLDSGWRSVNSGDYAQAIADFNEAIRLDPNNAQAFYDRGLACEDNGDPDAAHTDFDQAIMIDPKFADAYNDRAWLLATCPQNNIRDGKKAVEDATKACDLSAWKEPSYLDTLAAAYAEAGDFENAVNWENKSLAIPGQNAKDLSDAKNRLALYTAHKPYREVK